MRGAAGLRAMAWRWGRAARTAGMIARRISCVFFARFTPNARNVSKKCGKESCIARSGEAQTAFEHGFFVDLRLRFIRVVIA